MGAMIRDMSGRLAITKTNKNHMKRTILTLTGLVLALATFTAAAQDADTRPGRRSAPGEPPGNGRRPAPIPIMSIFDTNHDGVLSAPEIADASTVLKTLDKNHDGQITADEVRPRRAPDGRGPRGGGIGRRSAQSREPSAAETQDRAPRRERR